MRPVRLLPPPSSELSPPTLADLARSGLTDPSLLTLAGIRDSTDPLIGQLLAKRKVDGYLIPYFDVKGHQSRHYRIKVLSSTNGKQAPKYVQPRSTGNHVYLPPNLPKGWRTDTSVVLFVTEGEKKALAATANGFPTIAVGGVFSWRSHHVNFTKDGIKTTNTSITVDDRQLKSIHDEVAPELNEIEWSDREVFIVFDSDATSNPEVQRAAFELANWLEEKGAVPSQIEVPPGNHGGKLGLDDWLLGKSAKEARAILANPSDHAFRPLPSDPKGWLREQLNGPKQNRAAQERVADFMVAYLDAGGARYMGVDGKYYYFDYRDTVLHDFEPSIQAPGFRETSFGRLLARDLGVGSADSGPVTRLLDRFHIDTHTITPHRVLARRGDVLYYQLSDANVARVGSSGIELVPNGEDDVLFHAGVVETIDPDGFLAACSAWELGTPGGRWVKALKTVRLTPIGNFTEDETRNFLAILFYLSPWLNRWRGLMLPMEVAIAEAGSGKTFLYKLRKGVLTGDTQLSGLPSDFRSWVASVGEAPALWVCDNLGNVKSEYWHQLNDELARLITESAPTVELRRLFTTARVLRVPVDCAFAITAIKNPFSSPDLLQRSLVYGLEAVPTGQRDGRWVERRLSGNQRTEWVAEHLSVLQAFLKRIERDWDPNYRSSHRLQHFEQAMIHMGAVLKLPTKMIVKNIGALVSETVASGDPVIEAISTFMNERRSTSKRIRLRSITDWAAEDAGERFSRLRHMTNEVLLGRYIAAHKYDIQQATGLTWHRDNSGTYLEVD